MRLFLLTLLFLNIIATSLVAQFDGPPDTPEEYQKQYNWRIAQEKLNGVYIPANMAEAMSELNRLTDEESRAKFAAWPEDQVFRRLFPSLRLWMINKWGFNGGSRLSFLFHEMGLRHPDDLAELIIVSWHRELNGRDLNLKESIERILKARKAEWQAIQDRKLNKGDQP